MSLIFAGLYTDSVTYPSGASAPNIPVTIKPHGSGALATIYTDRVKSGTASNPVMTDAVGNLSFYAVPGLYDCTTVSGGTFTIEVGADPVDVGTGGGGGATNTTGLTDWPATPDARYDALGAAAAAQLASAPALTRVAKSADFTAVAGQLNVVDATTGVTVTIPAAQANKAVFAFKATVGTTSANGSLANPVTINLSGSDHFDTATGPTTSTVDTLNQLKQYQYDSATGIYTTVVNSLSLSLMDARYDGFGAASAVATGGAGFVLGTTGGAFGARPSGYALVVWVCQNHADDPSLTQTVANGDLRIRPAS